MNLLLFHEQRLTSHLVYACDSGYYSIPRNPQQMSDLVHGAMLLLMWLIGDSVPSSHALRMTARSTIDSQSLDFARIDVTVLTVVETLETRL